MKKVYPLLSFMIIVLCINRSNAQTTIFSENMGNPGATTAITSYSGWQNNATLTFTGTGDVRTSSPSSGYTGASGNGNVFLTTTAGKYFEMSGINTSACSSFTLSFGILISSTSAGNADFIVSVSTDGSTYSNLTLSPTIASITSAASYSLITITSGIPATANLRIRFTNATGTYSFRVDDVTLLATCNVPCSPPTKASSVGVSGVSTTSLTTSWTSGNGYGDVVVVSTSSVAPTPTGGITYNDNTVYGSGDAMGTASTVYNGTGNTVSITGLTCNIKYYIYVFEYNNTGTSAPCYTTSATTNTTTGACVPCSPPTKASAVSISSVSTSSLTTSWTSGNGYGDVVVVSTSSVAPTPTGGTTYNDNTVYGSGDAMGTAYTVYNGTGITVGVTGLTCNTKYYVYVFEYNNTGTSAPCYTISASSSATTSTCTPSPTYPVLTGIVVDACNSYTSTPACATTFDNSNCSEGRSEIAFFTAGTTSITPTQVHGMTRHVIDYYTTAWSSLTYWSGISMSNSVTTTYMNNNGCNSGTCSSCFKDAWTTGIPAGATFIMVADYYCLGTTNYANLCAATSPIYVIYFGASTNDGNDCNGGTTGTWDVSGNYTNASGTASTKGIAIDMSSLVAGAPTQYYTYAITSLVSCSGSADGGGIAYDGVSTSQASPITPNAYTSCQCNLNTVLPISLLNFTAIKAGENVQLDWTTTTETDNNDFDVEYSLDAKNFILYKQIKGAGNSNTKKEYSCLFDINVGDNAPYFRLKQVDFNGNYKYSDIITLGNNELSNSKLIAYYNTDKDKIATQFKLDYPQPVNISLYNVSGEEVFVMNAFYNEGNNQVLLDAPDNAGIYFLVYQNGSSAPIHKKILIAKQ